MADGRICVATIAGVHGVRGLVRLQSFTDPPAAIAGYAALSDEGGKPYRITIQSAMKGQFLARIEGIADRTQAETLKGTKLYVDRATLPEAEAGQFYHADLIGLAVVDPDGKALGTVAAIPNYGAGDILDVKGAEGREDFMVPFVRAFVPTVDIANGRIVIAPFEVVE